MFLGASVISEGILVTEAQERGLSPPPRGIPADSRRGIPDSCLLLQVMEELQAASVHSDEKELLQLLSTPHLRVVMLQSLHTHADGSPGTRGGGVEGLLGPEMERGRLLCEVILSDVLRKEMFLGQKI